MLHRPGEKFLQSRNNKQRRSNFTQSLINISKAATLLSKIITSSNFEKHWKFRKTLKVHLKNLYFFVRLLKKVKLKWKIEIIKMTKTHFQQPVFCKQAIHALLICNDQIPLEAYCTRRPYSFKFFKGCLPQNLLSPLFNALSQVCKIKYIKFLQFANIKQRKKLPHKFQRILNRSPYKKNFLILKLCVA